MPEISVIVPIYNVEKYLTKCVSSILNQTWKNLEVILVDDGSPDSSGKMCDAFAETDERIRVIHKENGGLSDARNVGIEAARGNYLLFVDSDDWIDSDMIETLYRIIQKTGADIAECSFRNVYTDRVEEETACSAKIVTGNGIDGIEGILDWRYFKPVAWNKLYRRSVIGDIRYPIGRFHEDEFTTYQFFYAAKKLVYIDVSKYNYVRNRTGSIVASYTEKNLDICFALRERREFLKEHCVTSLEEKANNIYCWLLLNNLAQSYRNNVSGEKLEKILKMAAEDLEYYQENPVQKNYIDWLKVVCQEGLQVFEKKWSESLE